MEYGDRLTCRSINLTVARETLFCRLQIRCTPGCPILKPKSSHIKLSPQVQFTALRLDQGGAISTVQTCIKRTHSPFDCITLSKLSSLSISLLFLSAISLLHLCFLSKVRALLSLFLCIFLYRCSSWKMN
jgi:hypothetical protein